MARPEGVTVTLPVLKSGSYREDAVAAVLAALPDPSRTAAVDDFEARARREFGSKHAIAVSSGTTALQTALTAAGIGPGCEVLVPALTVIMTAAAVVTAGATPVFCDTDTATLDLDWDDAAAKITHATAAIMPVHLWGRVGNTEALTSFARTHGLKIIEDAAQACGSSRSGLLAGTVGTAGCLSLKDGKILWCGEGGLILTDDDHLGARARALRSHWLQPPPGSGPLEELGTNVRLAEPLAALADANLRQLSYLLSRRRAQTRHLLDSLDGSSSLSILAPFADEQWNHYSPLFRVNLPRPRDFMRHLAELGVPNSVGSFHLVPCDVRPMFALSDNSPCIGAREIIDTTLAIVLSESDDEKVLDRHVATITRAVAQWAP